MSSGYLLSAVDEAIIWRGAKKTSLIKRFINDVDWSGIDVLVVDTPPGTSDEHLTLCQVMAKVLYKTVAFVVTTPGVFFNLEVFFQY